MVVEGETPTKKRRLDRRSALEQTNATLQHFIGGKHNRWMYGHVPTTTTATPEAPTHGRASHQDTRAAGARANAANSRAASTLTPKTLNSTGDVPSLRRAHHSSNQGLSLQVQHNRTPPDLVPYEAPPQTITSPSMIAQHTFQAAAPAVTSKKSVDRSKAAGPGLPSPAPSDENSNSPILAGVQTVQQRIRSVVSARDASLPFGAPPLPLSSPMAAQQQILPPGQPAHQQMTNQFPQVAGPSRPHVVQHGQHSHPQSRVRPRQPVPSNFPISSSNMAGPSPILQHAPMLPSNSGPPRQLASRVPVHVLLQRIDVKTAELRQAGTLSGTDNGRLALLREAVERGDWFYQVLSQLCCLRSVSPLLLPRSIRDLPNECYGMVDALLCANASVNSGLLSFFAEFPEPIMDIYSDPSQNVRNVFESRVNAVKMFLDRLPSAWDPVVAKSRQLSAPPLVQDMVDLLNMRSAVLQSTAFRAIARMFYGMREHEASGLNAVESVHRIDQDTYYRNSHRRSVAEKDQAYHMLRRVFEQWQQHQAAPGGTTSEFHAPQDVVQYFYRPPNSMMQLMQSRSQQRGQNGQIRPLPPQMAPGQYQQVQQRLSQSQGHGVVVSPASAHSPLNAIPFQPPGNLAGLQGMQPPFHMARAGSQTENNLQFNKPQLYHRQGATPRSQPTHPDTTRMALHQAHLRSPTLRPLAGIGSPQLYRHVVGFGVPPTRLLKDPSQMIKFNVSQTLVDRLPRPDPAVKTVGEPRGRAIGEDSIMYRLRCSALPTGGFATEDAWVTAENYWPEECAYEFNGTKLELRRKLHHGRYLPVDLTDLVKPGENTLKVFRNIRHDDKHKKKQYAMAVEVIGVISHPAILQKTSRVSAEESLDAIKKSLTDNDVGDDDLAVTSSTMSINLFDPFSACRIFDIPVRGASCLHRDCFDLETFLSQCKSNQPGWPVVDCWRCPLCRGDVRPQTLVIDEFLVRIREQLAAQGNLDTRMIVIEADGTWKPKEEERSGVRSPSLEREEMGKTNTPAPTFAAPKRIVEIIELD